MDFGALLTQTPAETFRLRETRPGSFQLIAPFFHEDGDMVSMYLEESPDGVKITDHGMSLMRLSYLFDIDTDNKKKVLDDIIAGRKAWINQGSIECIAPPDRLVPYVMNYAQLVSEVCNMDILSREFVSSMFYDYLREAVYGLDLGIECKENYTPRGYPDIVIDYAFLRDGIKRPIFLFGVRDTNKAQQATINCLQMTVKKIPNKSIAVFENLDTSLTKFSRNNLVNAVGKVFSDLDSFKAGGREFIEQELEIA